MVTISVAAAVGLLAAAALLVSPSAADGFDTGPWFSDSYELGSKGEPLDLFSPWSIRVTYPTYCLANCGNFGDGKFPVVVFATAFAGQVDTSEYDTLFTRIAKHGVVVVSVDQDIGVAITTNYKDLADSLEKVVDYVKGTGVHATKSLSTDMAAALSDGAPRLDKIIFAGHSYGAHVVLRRIVELGEASGGCSDVAGVVLINPVDGADPFGFGNSLIVDDDLHPVPFVTPGVVVYGDQDGLVGTNTAGLTCVREGFGGDRFFQGWQGGMWKIAQENIGHMDVLDADATTTFDQACGTIAPSDLKADYRVMVSGIVVTMAEGLFVNQGLSYGKFESSTQLGMPDLTLENKETSTVGVATCDWNPIPRGLTNEQRWGIIGGGVTFVITLFWGLWTFFRRMDADRVDDYVTNKDTSGSSRSTSAATKGGGKWNVGGQAGAAAQAYQQQGAYQSQRTSTNSYMTV